MRRSGTFYRPSGWPRPRTAQPSSSGNILPQESACVGSVDPQLPGPDAVRRERISQAPGIPVPIIRRPRRGQPCRSLAGPDPLLAWPQDSQHIPYKGRGKEGEWRELRALLTSDVVAGPLGHDRRPLGDQRRSLRVVPLQGDGGQKRKEALDGVIIEAAGAAGLADVKQLSITIKHPVDGGHVGDSPDDARVEVGDHSASSATPCSMRTAAAVESVQRLRSANRSSRRITSGVRLTESRWVRSAAMCSTLVRIQGGGGHVAASGWGLIVAAGLIGGGRWAWHAWRHPYKRRAGGGQRLRIGARLFHRGIAELKRRR